MTSSPAARTPEAAARDRRVRFVLVVEGTANAAVLGLKLVVALTTGSLAVLGDAFHSFTDVANNVVAFLVVRVSEKPADREHPYGHRKFETLAVLVLATLLCVLAIELVLGAFRRDAPQVESHAWSLALMVGVLAINIGLTSWEAFEARRLGSGILRADASHTLADVMTTIAVIAGWQIAARGYAWVDELVAVGVAGLILLMAYRLFRRVVPVLVDGAVIDADALARVIRSIPGVHSVASVRSRALGTAAAIDTVITVAPDLSTTEGHAIADEVETRLRRTFDAEEITVHVEPHDEG